MKITKSIQEFVVFVGDSILHAINKINLNQNRIVFVTYDNGSIAGSLSDGDIRRWITRSKKIDLNSPVEEAINRDVVFRKLTDDRQAIKQSFSSGISVIPLTDNQNRIIAIAIKDAEGITIGNKTVSNTSPAFIIAEIGNNHNGDIKLAKKLVELAKEAGADCAKFQMRSMKALYRNSGSSNDITADLGAQYTLDLLSKFQLTDDELIEVFEHAKKIGIIPLCTPWDEDSLITLENYGLPAYKVASADFTNHQFIEALAKTQKPLICSTGMCSEQEIKNTVELLNKLGVEYVLLHCNSTYPTPYKDINLRYLERLKELSGGLIGYSGHERGTAIPTASIAFGAKVIEKHFTIDRNMEGNDHKVSLLPDEFKQMVHSIRAVEEALGSANERTITQGELMNREVLAKSLVINCNLNKGETIKRDMVEIKSPGKGLQPYHLDTLLGQKAKRDFKAGDYFFESDLKGEQSTARNYCFNRPFGIPVRYHDYNQLSRKTNLDFVEFHLSYKDLELNISDFFQQKQNIDFAVHSPELFAGDHIMDLATDDEEYRQHSIYELKRVIKVTKSLKEYFPSTNKPVIVINAGGHSRNDFIEKRLKEEKYQTLSRSLKEVDLSEVTLCIQTMPPFPWHFGGQSFHNLFVDPNEAIDFCAKNDVKLCLDVSHSALACNYYNWDFEAFCETVGQYVSHLHIVDAAGFDGEGLQINEGELNFESLKLSLNRYCHNVQFIPEIWQGHKNEGQGFWIALERLESHGF